MKLKPYANIVEEATTGLRMPEELARQIADAAKGLPKDFTYRRVAKAAAEFQLEEGSRSDVSTVTTDAIDHQKEVVLPTGLDFAVFRSNPVVPFAHSYDVLPVGRCMWIKASGNGVAAMTKYAKCPPNHTDWLPDAILSLMQEGMCTGKSIGFIPTHMRAPTGEEVSRRPELKGAQVIIDKSTLLEYSVAPVPCNPEALTVAVSKSLGNTTAARMVVAAAKTFAKASTLFVPRAPAAPVAPAKPTREKIVLRTTAKAIAQALPEADDAPEPLVQEYTQYVQQGNALRPTGDVTLRAALPRHAYKVGILMDGTAIFEKMRPATDELYKFKNSTMESVLAEIDRFWDLKPEYDKLGLMHNRGIILHGPPGTGKTSILHQTAQMIVDRGDVVLYARNIYAVAEGLKQFREVEPARKVVVCLEDADEYVGYQEREFLQLLDGEQSISGVLYLATTNYLESFPPRLLRPGRFDQKVLVGPPPYEGRLAYLNAKLGDDQPKTEVERLAKETDGMNFGDLRELVTAVYALKEPAAVALARLRGEAVERTKSFAFRSAAASEDVEIDVEAPDTLAAFVSPETLAAYHRRLLDQLPARVEAAARAKFADALDRLRGRV
jgi:hypothetical protein